MWRGQIKVSTKGRKKLTSCFCCLHPRFLFYFLRHLRSDFSVGLCSGLSSIIYENQQILYFLFWRTGMLKLMPRAFENARKMIKMSVEHWAQCRWLVATQGMLFPLQVARRSKVSFDHPTPSFLLHILLWGPGSHCCANPALGQVGGCGAGVRSCVWEPTQASSCSTLFIQLPNWDPSERLLPSPSHFSPTPLGCFHNHS